MLEFQEPNQYKIFKTDLKIWHTKREVLCGAIYESQVKRNSLTLPDSVFFFLCCHEL